MELQCFSLETLISSPSKYIITAVLKVETDIITGITTSPIGWAALSILYEVIVFICNIIMYLCNVYSALLYFVRIRFHGVWQAIQLIPKLLKVKPKLSWTITTITYGLETQHNMYPVKQFPDLNFYNKLTSRPSGNCK